MSTSFLRQASGWLTFSTLADPAKATTTNNGSSTGSDGRSKLFFHRYGNAFFLAAAWVPNSDHARELYASANEIQVPRYGGQDVAELALLAKK